MAVTSPAVVRRRRLAALGVLAGGLLLVVVVGAITRGDGDEGGARGAGAGTAAGDRDGRRRAELPRGGRRILPDFRVVAFYGAPQDDELGILGIGTPDRAAGKLARLARGYARRSRPVLPALELISTIANADPGADGRFRTHQSDAVIRRYLRAARKVKGLLVLDVQPGRAGFFEEVTRLERWLREPDVSLALDPEWAVGPGQLPGQVIGSIDVRELNAVSAWLDQLVQRRRLPQKLLVVHQFTQDMIRGRERLKGRRGVAVTVNVDGFGDRPNKRSKYRLFTRAQPRHHDGFKLFFEEDVDRMAPRDVLALQPPPDFVVYE